MRRKPKLLALALTMAIAIAAGLSSVQAAELVSKASDGTPGNRNSFFSSISDDGRFVAFHTFASNLGPPDSGGQDIYVHDRMTGTNELVSVDSSGIKGNGTSLLPIISGNGRFVAFTSLASNLVLGDTNGRSDVFVHDRQSGTTERVNLTGAGNQSVGFGFDGADDISADGRFVVFISNRSYGVGEGGNTDTFVRDRVNMTTEVVSVDSSGNPQLFGGSANARISADGRFVAFSSSASSLVSNDGNSVNDVFIRDRLLRTTERVSNDFSNPANAAAGASVVTDISPDGNFVVMFSSANNLAPGDTNTGPPGFGVDIFVHDRSTGLTELVSVDSLGTAANGGSGLATVSADGQLVAFDSAASNLVLNDANGTNDIFLRDRTANTTERLSVAPPLGGDANNSSLDPQITPDGSTVAFHSGASNLVEGQSISRFQVYIVDLGGGGVNEPPVADAGPDQTPECTGPLTSVQLDGSASLPATGLSYSWTGGFGTTIGVAPTVDLPIGPDTINLTVDDGAGGTASDDVVIEVQDTTAPAITLDPVVMLTATSAQGAAHTVSPVVGDLCDPVVDVVISPDLAIFPPGTTSVTVTAIDDSGNIATAIQDVVVTFDCTGFQEPVENPPAVNTGKAGRTYPIKWQCFGQGGAIGDLGIVQSLQFTAVSCSDPGTVLENPMEADDAGQSGLRFNATTGRIIYAWKTPKVPACYLFTVELIDGTQLFANFDLF